VPRLGVEEPLFVTEGALELAGLNVGGLVFGPSDKGVDESTAIGRVAGDGVVAEIGLEGELEALGEDRWVVFRARRRSTRWLMPV
jgi:hypothetical protein